MNFFNALKPLIIAHRGASMHAPENTLAAFHLAALNGADAIELDAKLSADGQVIVLHDQTVSRTTNGSGAANRLSLEAMKELDAGQWFSPEFAGERIPTLAEVFEAVGDQLFINVELTNYASPRDPLPARVADLVQRSGLEDRVLFSSFNPVNLLRIRSRLPNAQIALLALPGLPGLVARSKIGRLVSPRFIHPSQTEVTQAYINKEHACKRKVNVWTVNDPAKMRQLFRWGVDGLFTDDPRSARQVLEQL